MHFRQLKYFIVVAECGSFSQAGEVLEVAQPALSRQIKDLENILGVDLFLRLPRGLELTPAGAILLRDSRSVLEMLEFSRLKVHQAARIAKESTLVRGIVSDFALIPPLWTEEAFKDSRVLLSHTAQPELETLTSFNLVDFYLSLCREKSLTGLQSICLKTEPAVILRRTIASAPPLRRLLCLREDLCQLDCLPELGAPQEAHAPIERRGKNFMDMISEARICDFTGVIVPSSVANSIPGTSHQWSTERCSYQFTFYLTYSDINENKNFSNLLRRLTKAGQHDNAL